MLEIRFLGQFEVQRDGKQLVIPTRNAQNHFAYLVLNAGKSHRRERLPGLLWPDSTVSLPRPRHSSLPKPRTSFIGREKEIQQVVSLISEARLVTITGSGGVGKTRLAIRVAEETAPQFGDGVWWIELAFLFEVGASKDHDLHHKLGDRTLRAEPGALKGADLVAQEVAKAMRISGAPDLPLLERVIEHLCDKKLLLALDNCEHSIEACAALVERLLSDCPTVTVLATSREALGVAGEKAWRLTLKFAINLG